MRRLACITVAATALAALTIGVAGAHKFTGKNTFKFDAIEPVTAESAIFEGRVIADGSVSQDPLLIECERRRLVKIIHKGVVITTDRTNKAGKWSAVGPLPPAGDKVIAKLKPETLEDSGKHKHVCAGDVKTRKSPAAPAPAPG